jgi:hypothetical protein
VLVVVERLEVWAGAPPVSELCCCAAEALEATLEMLDVVLDVALDVVSETNVREKGSEKL